MYKWHDESIAHSSVLEIVVYCRKTNNSLEAKYMTGTTKKQQWNKPTLQYGEYRIDIRTENMKPNE